MKQSLRIVMQTLGGLFISCVCAFPLSAQITAPSITTASAVELSGPVSAAEADHHVWIQQAKLKYGHSFRASQYPIDSIHHAVVTTAMKWLKNLKQRTVRGIQLDPSGHVGIAANEEAYAKQQIAERLAAPGLPFEDRAFTYMAAVQALSDPYHPEHLADAEAYLRQLDAMGNKASYWQFQARRALVDTYYMLGRTTDVIRHGMRAIEMMPDMLFFDRGLMYPYIGGDGELYSATVDALAGQAGGKAKIEALNTLLQQTAIPSAEVLAMDSAYAERGRLYSSTLQYFIRGHARLGSPGQAIISNYWVNWQIPGVRHDSAVVAVNDGKIRVLEVAGYNCPPCLMALQGLQRLKQTLPGIEVMMVTATSGSWGNRLVSPDEEAAHLTEYFLNNQKITFPIAIWKAVKVPTEDGGMTPDYAGPAFAAYPPLSKPTLWILDGKGIIRRVILGYDREKEAQIAKTVMFLQHEMTERH